MARFWINSTLDRTRGGAVVALCDRCAAEPETARAAREQGWVEVTRSHPRVREEGAWYCELCGELLEDVLPIRVYRVLESFWSHDRGCDLGARPPCS